MRFLFILFFCTTSIWKCSRKKENLLRPVSVCICVQASLPAVISRGCRHENAWSHERGTNELLWMCVSSTHYSNRIWTINLVSRLAEPSVYSICSFFLKIEGTPVDSEAVFSFCLLSCLSFLFLHPRLITQMATSSFTKEPQETSFISSAKAR